MSADITPIILMTGLTIVAVMIAINTHGRLRTVLSWSLATVLFTLTVVVIINHAPGLFRRAPQKARLSNEPIEKGIVDRTPARSSPIGRLTGTDLATAAALKKLSAEGTVCANALFTKELKDESVELETLVGRASEMRRRVEYIKNEATRIPANDPAFRKPVALIRDGVQLLGEAAQFYLQYYYAEDSAQETTRENLMRERARAASEMFQKAGNMLGSMK
jgi:hypothetical protein